MRSRGKHRFPDNFFSLGSTAQVRTGRIIRKLGENEREAGVCRGIRNLGAVILKLVSSAPPFLSRKPSLDRSMFVFLIGCPVLYAVHYRSSHKKLPHKERKPKKYAEMRNSTAVIL